MNEQQLKDLFLSNSDCYADTWEGDNPNMVQGDVVPAMTFDGFKLVIEEYKQKAGVE